MADTRRDGDRLLLVDLPSSTARAAAEYAAALRARGYRVEAADTRHIDHALLARTAGLEVVLTFHAREEVTRLEILFVGDRTS